MTTPTVILVALGVLVACFAWFRLSHKLRPRPAPPWLGRFLDSRFRQWLQSPREVVGRSGIVPAMKVLELGGGSGAFTTAAAGAVGEGGTVYAMDLQRGMLRQLQEKLARPANQQPVSVELIQASAYHLPFSDGSLDLAYLVAVLQEIPDRARALREIRRVLKPGGVLAVTELLPDPDYPLRSTTVRICQREGFVLVGNSGNLWNYTVRFRKPG